MEDQNQVSTPPGNVNTPIVPPVIPPKPKNVLLPVLLATIVSALIFGTLGYYIGKMGYMPQVLPYASPTPTITPIPTENPTIEWETYTGKEYSFKYPKGLASDTDAAGSGAESIRFRYMGPKQIASGRTQTSLFDGYAFIVTKVGPVSDKTPEALATERKEATKIGCSESTISESKQITIDTVSGIQYSVKNCLGDYTSSFVAHKDNVYEIIQLYTGEVEDQKSYEEITSQMFQTLKFF